MNKENTSWESKRILELIIWVLPAIGLPMIMSDVDGETSVMVRSMLFGGLGGVIGALLFGLTKDKSQSVKYIVCGLIVMGLIITMLVVNKQTADEKKDFITCQICGYKALPDLAKECYVCIAAINDEFREEEGYSTIEELIKEEQLYFFALEEGVSFEEPGIYKDLDVTFKKDKDWKPIVTQEEVELRRKEIDEIGKQIEIEIIKGK